MIRIKRNTGMLGFLGRIKIYINDEQAAKIKQDQSTELEIPSDEAKITVSQAGVLSNELTVKEGQVVEITTSLKYRVYFLFFVLAMFFVGLALPYDFRIFGYALLIVLPIAIIYFIEGYELKIIYP